MRILIVKLGSIGDIVHTLPALAALREGFPDAEISWVVE
jgi:heptosyltransferase-1